ncbi:MAG: AsmA-like C-terminal region-containing protein [Terriglobales bacterium]
MRKSRWWWIGLGVLAFGVVAGSSAIYAIYHAEPRVRAKIIETLSARFHARVELAGLSASVSHGLQVSGTGLKIFGADDPNPYEPGVQPLLAIGEFQFSAGVLGLMHSPMRVHRVYLRGLEINIPPKEQRAQNDTSWKKEKIKILVDEFVCDQARLIINTLKPGKPPLEFAISDLYMKDIGPGQPLHFDAILINPKPVGKIQSSGYFGPWQPDNLRSTPVRGQYSFSNADLSTIKGIGGILSSTGSYHGNMGGIVVDGKTETPDFRLAISDHPVPLSTEFHAIVDGTSGDTYLQPVNARLQNSDLIAKGSVVRMKNQSGHKIVLDVVTKGARIEDLLRVALKPEPPAMIGKADFNAKFELHPGSESVADRLDLAGKFEISGAKFTNATIQARVDELSERSLGKPALANSEQAEVIQSEVEGAFSMRNGLLSFSDLRFHAPGASVHMVGSYQLDGSMFDFHGKTDLNAKVSQLVTGWKSKLLKPVDPFFSKNGAGTEVPIKVTGTKSQLHFGLDWGHRKQEAKDKAPTANAESAKKDAQR